MASINFKVDNTVKEQAETVFKSLGMNTTAAITMFLRETARQGRIPFDQTAGHDVKDLTQAAEICEKLGMPLDTAINVFLKAIIREQRFPFEIAIKEEPAGE